MACDTHEAVLLKNTVGELELVCRECGEKSTIDETQMWLILAVLTGKAGILTAIYVALLLNYDEVANEIPRELLEKIANI